MHARILVACTALMLAGAAHAQHYTVTDLSALAGSSSGVAFAVNAGGAVVGENLVGSAFQGFLYQGGSIASIGPSGFAPSGINASGLIVGQTFDFSQYAITNGYLLDGGSTINLSTEPGALKGTQVAGLNDAGVVAGAVYTQADSNGVATVAATYSGRGWTQLGMLTDDYSSAASAINSAGVVVGASLGASQRGFVYSGGTMTALDSLIVGGDATPSAINDAGTIAGGAEVAAGGQHAVTWTGTAIHDLGTLGGNFSIANGIDIAGNVVGNAQVANGKYHAFVDRADVMLDLNGLIDGPNTFAYLSNAFAINIAGQIVGEGVMGDGSLHAFLLSPVPEPAGWALLLAALPLIGAAARRRQPA